METNGVVEQFADVSQTPAEDVALLAYSLWQARGEVPGSAEQDWFQAEELLRNGELASAAHG
jgi:hypothetical protein